MEFIFCTTRWRFRWETVKAFTKGYTVLEKIFFIIWRFNDIRGYWEVKVNDDVTFISRVTGKCIHNLERHDTVILVNLQDEWDCRTVGTYEENMVGIYNTINHEFIHGALRELGENEVSSVGEEWALEKMGVGGRTIMTGRG